MSKCCSCCNCVCSRDITPERRAKIEYENFIAREYAEAAKKNEIKYQKRLKEEEEARQRYEKNRVHRELSSYEKDHEYMRKVRDHGPGY